MHRDKLSTETLTRPRWMLARMRLICNIFWSLSSYLNLVARFSSAWPFPDINVLLWKAEIPPRNSAVAKQSQRQTKREQGVQSSHLVVFKRSSLSILLSGWPTGGHLPDLLQDRVIITAPQQWRFTQEMFVQWHSATSRCTACPNLQLCWSLPHTHCKPVTSLSCSYLTSMIPGCTIFPRLAVIFCFHHNILTLFSNADSHYDNDENYLGICNFSSLPGLSRLYISRLQYALWEQPRWITAAIPQNPTGSKSGWGQKETSTAKEN